MVSIKLQLGDYLNARARTKIRKFRRDYAAKNIAFAPAIFAPAIQARFILHFYVSYVLRLLWVLADILQSRWGRRGHRERAIQVESG